MISTASIICVSTKLTLPLRNLFRIHFVFFSFRLHSAQTPFCKKVFCKIVEGLLKVPLFFKHSSTKIRIWPKHSSRTYQPTFSHFTKFDTENFYVWLRNDRSRLLSKKLPSSVVETIGHLICHFKYRPLLSQFPGRNICRRTLTTYVAVTARENMTKCLKTVLNTGMWDNFNGPQKVIHWTHCIPSTCMLIYFICKVESISFS